MAPGCGLWVLVLIVLLCFSMEPSISMAAVYKVGDSAGWTTVGNVDYKLWASTKTFQLGDIILFQYNKQFHNVMQVKHGDYQSCNASTPIATHSTGNDSFTVKTHGHHYFFCAVPGHCQAGQKVDINVPRLTDDQSTNSSPALPPVSSTNSPLPLILTSPPPVAAARVLPSLSTPSANPSPFSSIFFFFFFLVFTASII